MRAPDKSASNQKLPVASAGAQSTEQPHLYYLVDWLPPEFGAVGQYAAIFAREYAECGRQVTLLGLTSGAPTRSFEEFPAGGSLEILKVHSPPFDKSGNAKRLIWAAQNNFRRIRTTLASKASRRADVIFTGSPPFMLFFAILLKPLRRARLIYRITDFYPEVVIAALGKRPLLMRMLERITWALRKQVDLFQALGEDQRRLLIEGGISADRIMIKGDVPPVNISSSTIAAPRPERLSGKKLLLYSGNFGVAHEWITVAEGLIQYQSKGGQFALWLNASGAGAKTIVNRLQEANASYALTPPVHLDELPQVLAAADVHLITLRPQFAGLVLPSKIYACIASGRPILFVGPENSDVHALCKAANTLYERVEPGDIASFCAALDRLNLTIAPSPAA